MLKESAQRDREFDLVSVAALGIDVSDDEFDFSDVDTNATAIPEHVDINVTAIPEHVGLDEVVEIGDID